MSHRTSVGALPTQPTIISFHGLLAQLRRASVCPTEGRGSKARTGRHFNTAREGDINPPRLERGDTRGSTEARDHFISSRVRADHGHPASKRNYAGAIPAGSKSSQRTECAARLLSGVSLVRCQGEEPFYTRSASGRSRKLSRKQSHFQRCPRFESLALRHFIHTPAWCNSSTLGSQPGNPGALPGAGATFFIAR
jgi:hypothetical protein